MTPEIKPGVVIPVPAQELEDLLKALTQLVEVLTAESLSVPVMAALLDLRDACNTLDRALA